MAFDHKPGSFSLFKNDKEGGKDTWPDYKGTGKDLDGNDIEVAAWIKQGSKGGKFMSCTLKTKQAREATRSPAPYDGSTYFDDNIPF